MNKILAGIGTVIIAMGIFFIGQGTVMQNLASVEVSNEYMSTSTALSAGYGAQTGEILIKTGQGSLGSVVITGAASGVMNFYDATTTDNTLRASVSTSTLLIASLPGSLVAGTYTFDIEYTTGLYLDIAGGDMPTTTITYR